MINFFSRVFGGSSSTEGNQPPRADATAYVEWLFSYVLNQSGSQCGLSDQAALPSAIPGGAAAPQPVPSFSAVANRLKFLCGINPVPCKTPKQATIERPRKNCAVFFDVTFRDGETPARLLISAKVKKLSSGA